MKNNKKIGRLKRILTGWLKALNIIEVTPADKVMSDLRLRYCSDCKHSYKSKILEIVNGEDRQVDALICNACHCPCLEKTLVVAESCPIKLW